jgi:hypothetical protein
LLSLIRYSLKKNYYRAGHLILEKPQETDELVNNWAILTLKETQVMGVKMSTAKSRACPATTMSKIVPSPPGYCKISYKRLVQFMG